MAKRKKKKERKPYLGHIRKHGRRVIAQYSVRNEPKFESFPTEEEAINFLTNFTNRYLKGHAIPVGNMRMEHLFDLLLTDLRNNGRRSVADAKTRIDLHLKPFFEGMKVSSFRGADIEQYKRHRLDQEIQPAPATINRELALLRRAYYLAVEQELIEPRLKFKNRFLKERNTITRTFSAGEFETFRKHFHDVGVLGAVDFQYEVGWRMPSEVLPLEWNQIDFDEESVTLEPYSTKDEKSRVFYFTNRMREILSEQRARVKELQKKFGRIISNVFVNDQGKVLIEVNHDKEGIRHVKPSWYFRTCWNKALEEAKISKTTHDLRRTAAVVRDNAGLSRTDNMLLGGWSSPAMLDRYLQKRKEDLKSAIKKLDEHKESTLTKDQQTNDSAVAGKKVNH